MNSLADITEQLPSLLLPLPAQLLHAEPEGDAEKYRDLYLELTAMAARPDLLRLQAMAAELADEQVTATAHGNARNDTQDWWFGTRRVRGDIYLIVLHGLVTAFIHALSDMNSQPLVLEKRKTAMLRRGLAEMAGVAYEFLYRRDGRRRTRARKKK